MKEQAEAAQPISRKAAVRISNSFFIQFVIKWLYYYAA